MTDINELAQRMSIERIKQIARGGTPIVGEKERLAITALYFSEQLKIATDAFQAAGLAQLAAEEALEKAQADGSEYAASERAEAVKNVALQDEIYGLKSRIAELESRTFTVKQFDDFQIVHYGGTEDYAKGYIDCQNNYNKALSVAGIQIQGGE